MKDTLPVRVRLGAFELDLRTGELRQGDQTTRLQEKSFRLLRCLVEHRGALVTRGEVRERLWPNDTVVDFDHGINSNIKKLRTALGDSAESPKYVETLPGRGYRLLVTVEEVELDREDCSARDEGREHRPQAESQTAAHILIGRKVSHYRVLEVIGGGGMGVVYRAEDLKLGREVALKFLPEEVGNDPQALERFEGEARAASALDHPNICSIYEFGEHEGQPFIVMQLLEGQTLRDRLAAGEASGEKGFPPDELLDIAIQVTHGLQAAHQKGIIHRDIKPANIFLTSSGQVKILDFGLAKLSTEQDLEHPHSSIAGLVGPTAPETGDRTEARNLDPPSTDLHLTRTGLAMGTAAYMSPEQVRGEKLDARSDIFSFGLVLYEMATGQRAFTGETATILHEAILHGQPPRVRDLSPQVPPQLEQAIEKSLQKEPIQRYQNFAQMEFDLGIVRDNGGSGNTKRSWKTLRAAAVALLLVMSVAAFGYWRWRTATRITDKDTIVLAGFVNSTGEPAFGDALQQALDVGLRQSPFLNLLTKNKYASSLKSMGKSNDAAMTVDTARAICLLTNSRAVVVGSVADDGNQYLLRVKAVNCQTGRQLAGAEAEAVARTDVVHALGLAILDLRRKLGEPKSTLQEFNKPLEEATTSSIEALEALAQGNANVATSLQESIEHYQLAVLLDRQFARAYLNMGFMYFDLIQEQASRQNYTRAYQLRARMTAPDRHEAENQYYFGVTRELEKAIRSYRELQRAFVHAPVSNELSIEYRFIGQFEEAANQGYEAVRSTPTVFPYVNLGSALLSLGRLDEADAIIRRAFEQNLDSPWLRQERYYIAFLRHDEATMQVDLNWAMNKPGAEDLLLENKSSTLAYYGHFRQARQVSQQAVASAARAHATQIAAYWRGDEAMREVEAGNLERGRVAALAALAAPADADSSTKTEAAFTLARTGEVEKANQIAEQLDREFPVGTLMQNFYLPLIRAAIAIEQGHAERAIAGLNASLPYELGGSDWGNLYPAYMRGLAWLQLKKGREAAGEFRKLLDHPGVVINAVTGALAHLQLGRAQVMMGDKAAARKTYQDFLTLWKDADRDIPVYQQAKAEYAKLR